jgi:hypothetical protein
MNRKRSQLTTMAKKGLYPPSACSKESAISVSRFATEEQIVAIGRAKKKGRTTTTENKMVVLEGNSETEMKMVILRIMPLLQEVWSSNDQLSEEKGQWR